MSFLFYSQSSNLLNQARLRVLKARDEHKDNVLNDAKIQLGNITRDQQKYSNLLSGLIAQVRINKTESIHSMTARLIENSNQI